MYSMLNVGVHVHVHQVATLPVYVQLSCNNLLHQRPRTSPASNPSCKLMLLHLKQRR